MRTNVIAQCTHASSSQAQTTTACSKRCLALQPPAQRRETRAAAHHGSLQALQPRHVRGPVAPGHNVHAHGPRVRCTAQALRSRRHALATRVAARERVGVAHKH
jgi:hypothetical protein